MLDKENFLEKLEQLKAYAGSNGNRVTVDEINEFFGDSEWKKKFGEPVYTYLTGQNIKVDGFVKSPDSAQDAGHMCRYRYELNILPLPDEAGLRKNFLLWKEGDQTAREQLVHAFLPDVVKIAGTYKNRGASVADLIQEGNIGLLQGIDAARGLPDFNTLREFAAGFVRQEIERCLDEELNDSDQLETVLAKTNLLLEAVRVLSEDLVRLPTVSELCEYTRIPEPEMRDMLELCSESFPIKM